MAGVPDEPAGETLACVDSVAASLWVPHMADPRREPPPLPLDGSSGLTVLKSRPR